MTRRETRALARCLFVSRIPAGDTERDLFGVRISLGSVQACCKAVSAAVVNTTEVIHAEVKQAPELHADETGFGRCGKDRMWLWVAATDDAEVFRLLPGRGRDQAKDLLGDDYSGLIHRDRWKPYEVFKNASHQLCHSHIRRDFQSMLESMGETGTQGCMLKMASDRAFHLWHRFERGEISRKQLIRLTKPIQDEIWQRLEIPLHRPSSLRPPASGTKSPRDIAGEFHYNRGHRGCQMNPIRSQAGPLSRLASAMSWPFAALAITGILALGCGDSNRQAVKEINPGETAAKATVAQESAPRVALIMKTLTNPFFVEMEKGARKAQQETKIDLQVKTATQETSIEQQIQLVANEIKNKVQAIVIAPGDSMLLVPILKKAQDAGIQIVNIDNRLNPKTMADAGMKPVPFISVDNEKGAYEATRFVVDGINLPGEAAVIEGIRSANNAELRKRGAERGLRSNPKLKLVAEETANWKIDEAYGLTRALFKAHPGIVVLFCANDMMAIGAIRYLQEAGKTQVKVIGFDALAEARKAVLAGQLAVTVDQQPDQQGYLGITTALRLLHGETVPMDLEVATKMVTSASLK